jgi:TRAP-type C4-dicarboxylate transport system permease small subunit
MKILIKANETISMILLAGGALMGMTNVICRYIFNRALIWGDEATLYFFIWMLFFSVCSISFENRHLKTDFLIHWLTPESRSGRLLKKAADALGVVISLIIAYYGLAPVQTALQNGRHSDTGVFHMGLIYAVIPIGFALNAIVCLAILLLEHKNVTEEDSIK